jgi:hypothetical protein
MRTSRVRVTHALAAGLWAGGASTACAQFAIYQGGNAAELAWRSAAGGGSPVPLENFESYSGVPGPFSGPSDIVPSLPGLGIVLYGAASGTYPGVYANASQARSGVNQLANFGGGGAAFSDYFIEPEPGKVILGLGFWQCDPQGNQTMEACNASGVLVGAVTALVNDGSGQSFGGFVSSEPILRVRVVGALGDGWNHIDDLQVVVASVCGSADYDCDGDIGTDADIEAFFACLGGTCPPSPCTSSADFDGDGDIGTDADIEAFFRVLGGGAC